MDWDPEAVRKTLGLSTGGFEGAKRPKGLIHTTEGFTLDSALGAYRNNGYAPHVTIGPHPDGGERVQRWQHYPFSSRATTLADRSGGVRTNRLWVYQVEVVGTCDDQWKGTKFGQWHVDNWPAWYRDAVADLMTDWEKWFDIPRKSTVTFRAYPGSYGTAAPQRLSPSAFSTYTGWLGHQHAPENTHGDPGDLDIKDLFVRMGGTTPTEEDVPLTTAEIDKIATRVLEIKKIPNRNDPSGAVANYGNVIGHLSNMEATQDVDHATLRQILAQVAALNGAVSQLAEALAAHAEGVDADALVAAVRGAAEAGALAALESVPVATVIAREGV